MEVGKYKLIVINFADKKFEYNRKFCSETALSKGLADKVIEYSPEMIDGEFRARNKETLSIPRGAGLWLWKPYFIKRTLDEMKDGDYLFYTDAGVVFIRPINLIIEATKNFNQDIIPFELPLLENEWTKNETQTAILGPDVKFCDNQILATYILIRNSAQSRKFVSEWLNYMENPVCSHPETITAEPNDKNFIAHREDQSVFSLLCKKHKLKTFREPSQYGNREFEYCCKRRNKKSRMYKLTKVKAKDSFYPLILISTRINSPRMVVKKERIKNILWKLGIYNYNTVVIKREIKYMICQILRKNG